MRAFVNVGHPVQHPHRTDKAYGEKYRNKEQGMCSENY
jgi:hypothetical protein